MRVVVKELMNDRPLEQRHRAHELSGECAGVHECHVELDWLLIYDRESALKIGSLKLIRMVTHNELF